MYPTKFTIYNTFTSCFSCLHFFELLVQQGLLLAAIHVITYFAQVSAQCSGVTYGSGNAPQKLYLLVCKISIIYMGSVLTVIRISLTLDLFLNFLRWVFLPASDWDF